MGIPVGFGWLEVKEPVVIDGVETIHVEVHGKTNDVLSAFYPIHDTLHSFLDPKTFQPVRFEKYQREGRYRADEVVTFDWAHGQAHYRSLLNGSEKDVPIQEDVHDLISAYFWLRMQPLTEGEVREVTIYSDEKLFHTQVRIGPRGPLELLKRGTFDCMRVEPQAAFKGLLVKRGRLWAYLTADKRRLPLLVEATTPWGRMSAVLTVRGMSATPTDGEHNGVAGRGMWGNGMSDKRDSVK
jgi:hypothetical protein